MKFLNLLLIALLLFSCTKKSNEATAKKIRLSADNIELLDRSKFIVKRRENRLYEGAPPVIPHRLEVQFSDTQSCLNCHEPGKMHGPNVLHANQLSCTQCHVVRQTEKVFRETNYKKYFSDMVHKRSNPIGPPYIPHRLQDRKNCAICHIDDGAEPSLVPRHGNLMNCIQCHVQLQPTRTDFIQNKKR